MISINWQTLSFADNRVNTSFISPITLTTNLSNWMILHEDGVGWPLIFLHTESDMTLDEAPESTKQLYTLWLKISKDNKKGKVWDLDFPPMLASLISLSDSTSSWELLGRGSKYSRILFLYWGKLHNSNREIFSFVFLMSSSMSYPISYSTGPFLFLSILFSTILTGLLTARI